ncbi:hypothetical protein VPH35_044577 [Triticum aestivum]
MPPPGSIADERLSTTPRPVVVIARCLAAAERRLPSGSHAPSKRRHAFSHQCVAPVSSAMPLQEAGAAARSSNVTVAARRI